MNSQTNAIRKSSVFHLLAAAAYKRTISQVFSCLFASATNRIKNTFIFAGGELLAADPRNCNDFAFYVRLRNNRRANKNDAVVGGLTYKKRLGKT